MQPTLFVPRPYQVDAIKATLAGHRAGKDQVVLSLPTGAGKTGISREIIQKLFQEIPRGRALTIVPFKDLVSQTRKAYLSTGCFSPFDVGIIQGEHDQLGRRVTIASLDTIGKAERLARLTDGSRPFDVVFFDECHYKILGESVGRIIDATVGLGTLLAGLSATPFRGDNLSIAPVFPDGVIYSISTLDLILQGYLADIEPYDIETSFSLTNMEAEGLEELDEDGQPPEKLLKRLRQSDRYERAFQAWLDRSGGSMRTVIFAQDLTDCQGWQRYLAGKGYECAYVNGKTPDYERARVYQAFSEGSLPFIVNYNVLSTGIDIPSIQCIIIARVMSEGLGRQAIGRGLRLEPVIGKDKLLLLYLTDKHHTLSGIHTLLGRTDIHVPSVRKAIEEEVEKELPKEKREEQQPIEVRLGQVRISQVNMFSGAGWKHNPITGDFTKDVNGLGRVVAERDLTGFRVYHLSKAGRRTWISREPLTARLAKAKGQEHLDYLKVREEKKAGTHPDLEKPITEEQWKLLKRRLVPGLGESVKVAQDHGMQQRQYFAIWHLLEQHHTAIEANRATSWKCQGPVPRKKLPK